MHENNESALCLSQSGFSGFALYVYLHADTCASSHQTGNITFDYPLIIKTQIRSFNLCHYETTEDPVLLHV